MRLKPNKIYTKLVANRIVGREFKVYYFTSTEDKLVGSYITKEAAEEGLRIYIKEQKEKEEEIEAEKLIPQT